MYWIAMLKNTRKITLITLYLTLCSVKVINPVPVNNPNQYPFIAARSRYAIM